MPNSFPILVVEDDPEIVYVLNRAAGQVFPEATFISVTSFTQAASYLDDLTGYGPRLILLDLDLSSQQTGLDFLIRVRAHPQGMYLPVLIQTANNDSHKIEDAYFKGATSVHRKPFSFTEWKAYVALLKEYWYEVVTLPKVWFVKEEDIS